MLKPDLIKAISAETGLRQNDIGSVLDAIKTIAERELIGGRPFDVPGVVKMSVQDRAARIGRNPANGEPVSIPAKRSVKARVPLPLQAKVA